MTNELEQRMVKEFFVASCAELVRAINKFGWQGNLPLSAHLSIIAEEVGEVARLLNDAANAKAIVDLGDLRRELLQVSAMTAKMYVVASFHVAGQKLADDLLREVLPPAKSAASSSSSPAPAPPCSHAPVPKDPQ